MSSVQASSGLLSRLWAALVEFCLFFSLVLDLCFLGSDHCLVRKIEVSADCLLSHGSSRRCLLLICSLLWLAFLSKTCEAYMGLRENLRDPEISMLAEIVLRKMNYSRRLKHQTGLYCCTNRLFKLMNCAHRLSQHTSIDEIHPRRLLSCRSFSRLRTMTSNPPRPLTPWKHNNTMATGFK